MALDVFAPSWFGQLDTWHPDEEMSIPMVDFNTLKNKALAFVEKNEDKIDKGIDKAGDAAGKKFGHRDQIDKAADKLQDLTVDPDEKRPQGKKHPKP